MRSRCCDTMANAVSPATRRLSIVNVMAFHFLMLFIMPWVYCSIIARSRTVPSGVMVWKSGARSAMTAARSQRWKAAVFCAYSRSSSLRIWLSESTATGGVVGEGSGRAQPRDAVASSKTNGMSFTYGMTPDPAKPCPAQECPKPRPSGAAASLLSGVLLQTQNGNEVLGRGAEVDDRRDVDGRDARFPLHL